MPVALRKRTKVGGTGQQSPLCPRSLCESELGPTLGPGPPGDLGQRMPQCELSLSPGCRSFVHLFAVDVAVLHASLDEGALPSDVSLSP